MQFQISASPTNQKEDSQYHFLTCQFLLTQLTWEKHKRIQGLICDDLYSTTAKQKLAVAGFTWLLDTRERLLEAATPASGATLVAAPSPGSNRGLSQNSVSRRICHYLNNRINEEKNYNYNQTLQKLAFRFIYYQHLSIYSLEYNSFHSFPI